MSEWSTVASGRMSSTPHRGTAQRGSSASCPAANLRSRKRGSDEAAKRNSSVRHAPVLEFHTDDEARLLRDVLELDPSAVGTQALQDLICPEVRPGVPLVDRPGERQTPPDRLPT